MNAELISELRKIDAFHDLPEEALAWLAEHATVHTFQPGEMIMQEGEVADRMTIILEGELQGRRESLGPDAPVYTGRAGQVTGMLPFSRMTHYTITGRALGFTRIATIPAASFPEMLHQIPTLGPRLVGVLTDRVREVTRQDLQRDKLAALGKLSAGLAHELNNPASAGSRAAASLGDAFERLRAANAQLDNSKLSAEQKNHLRAIETAAQGRQAQGKGTRFRSRRSGVRHPGTGAAESRTSAGDADCCRRKADHDTRYLPFAAGDPEQHGKNLGSGPGHQGILLHGSGSAPAG